MNPKLLLVTLCALGAACPATRARDADPPAAPPSRADAPGIQQELRDIGHAAKRDSKLAGKAIADDARTLGSAVKRDGKAVGKAVGASAKSAAHAAKHAADAVKSQRHDGRPTERAPGD
jgi:hypothetical protein